MAKGKSRKKGGQPGNKNSEVWTEKKAMALGFELQEWMGKEPDYYYPEKGQRQISKGYLFANKFLSEQNLDEDIIGWLCKKYSSFADLYKKAKYKQEQKLIELGCTGVLNPALTIFVLKNHHGYKDKIEDTVIDVSFDTEESIKSDISRILSNPVISQLSAGKGG